ncbi:hypothetical protein [Amycolatopsis thermoflava]
MLKFCLDWSEQRHHLAGALGAALAERFLEQGWVTRRRPGHRALRLTESGADILADRLGIRATD